MTAPQLLTEDQAAERLMMSARTLRDIRRLGKIRYVRLSPRIIGYRPEDCDEYVSHCLRMEPQRESTAANRKRARSVPRAGNVVSFSEVLRAGR